MNRVLRAMGRRSLGQRRFLERGWRVVLRDSRIALPLGGSVVEVRVTHVRDLRSFRALVFSDRLFLLDEQIVGGQYLDELRRLRPLLRKRARDGTVYLLDGGANVGLFSLFARVLLGSNVHTTGFEPLDDNVRLLERNWQALPCRIHQAALSEREGMQPLYVASSTGATLSEAEADLFVRRFGGDRAASVQVVATRLDAVSLDVPRLDLVKLDVEGAEESAVKGARATIERYRPVVLCSYEHGSNDRARLIELITSLGAYAISDNESRRLLTFAPLSAED